MCKPRLLSLAPAALVSSDRILPNSFLFDALIHASAYGNCRAGWL